MHFCMFAARLYSRVSVPRKIGLNWFMPALLNSSVGSSSGTTLDDGTNVWPCFLQKKSRNCWRISEEGIISRTRCSGSRTESDGTGIDDQLESRQQARGAVDVAEGRD